MKKIIVVITASIILSFMQIQAQTWSSLIRLTWNSGKSYTPFLTTDAGSGVHVVWADDTPVGYGNFEILCKWSFNGGATWSAIKRLTWTYKKSLHPSLSLDTGSGIHLVWQDDIPGNNEIFYKRSTDSGATWSGPTRLTWNAFGSERPCIATDSGNGIHVVWQNYIPSNYEIFYKRSTDGGASWFGLTRLTWSSGDSYTQSIATDSSNGIHVVWRDHPPGSPEIFYKRSTDGGSTWSGPTRLTWNAGDSGWPSIATDSGNGIHVVWQNYIPSNYEIFYKRSSDGGATWSGLTRLTWNVGKSYWPSVATDSGSGIHVVWNNETSGGREIFYKCSSDGGATWSSLKRLTWNATATNSAGPSIATDSGNGIHVAWESYSPGNPDIFYKNRK